MFRGSFFTGVYLTQKLVLLPPIETQYVSVQKHVSSYILKTTPVTFVSPLRTVVQARSLFIIEDNSLMFPGTENGSRLAHFFGYLVKNDCPATVGNEKKYFESLNASKYCQNIESWVIFTSANNSNKIFKKKNKSKY
jgi:hypothetical protein